MIENTVTDRVIIVTGGGHGIGRGIVRHLGDAGARVVVAEWKPDLLDEAVKELEADGVECLGVVTDVQQRGSIEEMVAQTVARFGQVDGLVNNAMTFGTNMPLAELTEAALDISLVSGVKGTLWGMQAVYPHMKRTGYGRIINVGSSAGLIGFKGMGAYGAAKEAIRSLTRTAAREWAVDGIVVNCFCPVSIGPNTGRRFPESPGGMSVRILDTLRPMEREDDPEHDIGPVVQFLCSQACHYLTGQTLTIDGGAYAFA